MSKKNKNEIFIEKALKKHGKIYKVYANHKNNGGYFDILVQTFNTEENAVKFSKEHGYEMREEDEHPRYQDY